ncbi:MULTISPECIES: spore coat protein [Sporosarcina]|nr:MULTISPECIES: spore coat protein [Sporosarcina]MBY0223449.1 spore coat protein [Sporosarcina aquimarina]SKB06504.1 spore coat protein X [Sporosarcina newyorkensis]
MSHHYEHEEERWSALDTSSKHPCAPCSNDSNNTGADADVISDIDQFSNEVIVIRDSCDVMVSTTDTQVAVSLQAALQVAIAFVVNISIADGTRAEKVTAELLERAQIRQTNRQKLIIENSRNIEVTTVDTDVAISLQLLLQILLALIVQLDIL